MIFMEDLVLASAVGSGKQNTLIDFICGSEGKIKREGSRFLLFRQYIPSQHPTHTSLSFPFPAFSMHIASSPFSLPTSNPNQHPMNPYNLIFFINEQEETLKGDHPRRLRVPHSSFSVGKTSLLNAYGSPHSATSIKNSCNHTRPPSVLTSWRRKSSSMGRLSISR